MRISQREKALLGYTLTSSSSRSQTSIQNPDSSSSRNTNRSSDIDFSDVFGGPPRRSGSFQDLQRRFHDDDSNDLSNGEDGESFTGRGNPAGSTPVFGADVHSRRQRYPSDDFYDDIFGGDHPSTISSSPRTSGGKNPNQYSSAPGSRVLSPTRPSTLGVEPVGSPAQFSLPARLVPTVHHPSSSSYRPSPLSSSKSSNNLDEVWSKPATSQTGVHDEEPKRSSSVTSSDHNHFHFSIYKWASKGVPLSMSMRSGTRFKEKSGINTNKLEKSLNSIHSVESDTLIREIHPENLKVDDDGDSLKPTERATKESAESKDNHEGVSRTPSFRSNENVLIANVSDGEVRKKTSSKIKAQVKPTLTVDTDGEAEKILKLKESIRILREQMEESNKGGRNVVVEKENIVKRNTKGKAGKVKEFAKIFNQEVSVKSKNHTSGGGGQSQNSVRSNIVDTTSTAGNLGTLGSSVNKQAFNVLGKEEDKSHVSTGDMQADNIAEVHLRSVHFDNMSSSTKGSIPIHAKDISTNNDVIDEASISIEEIPEVEEEPTESNEDNQILDSKVLKWSKGKEGNIRALLSTLQYVLWPNSGWKPVPLVDIIEASSVKRSYQRALLCLHPDKLQQKGAASDVKYIAARVFDILQEAWDQFNTLGSL